MSDPTLLSSATPSVARDRLAGDAAPPVAPMPTDRGAGRGPSPSSHGEWRAGPASGHILTGACVACDRVAFHPADPADRAEVTSPESAAAVLVPRFAGVDRERCLTALLDTKHRLLEVVVVSIGSLDHTFMSPREVFRDALLANAAALVLAHNHPSGDPEPSRDDETVTRRLVRAGELVGIDVLDHLVVAGERWVSLARRGVV
jgi:DNA repair protein RadC